VLKLDADIADNPQPNGCPHQQSRYLVTRELIHSYRRLHELIGERLGVGVIWHSQLLSVADTFRAQALLGSRRVMRTAFGGADQYHCGNLPASAAAMKCHALRKSSR
jgi:hypothetical protein